MARYVMANRRAGKFLDVQKTASRAALEVGFSNLFAASVNVVNDLAPTDELARRVVVFDADPEEVSAKAVTLPTDVIVEPEILHFPVGGSRGKARPVAPATDRSALRAPAVNPAALAGAPLATLADVTAAPTFTIGVTGSGAPLHGAEVMLFLAGVREPVSSLTAANGVAGFSLPPGSQVGAAVASPAGGHWSMVSRSPANGSTIDCLPFQSVGPIDWWHRQLGVVTFDPTRGSGIRIGVIDSGVGPHGCLAHAIRAGAFINGGHDPAGGADVDSHGTHVSGLIGARPVGAADRGGIAPGAGLFVARVFPAPHQGASQADIANAIDHLSRTLHTDLINLSLGAPQPSQISQDAIQDAAERGTLCVCAAGNSRGRVEFPGGFPEVITVSALGLQGTSPKGSVSALNTPTDPAKHGAAGLFLADFSCFGPEVDTIAPGVGTISTVPERFGLTRPYAVMDGTSMASPLACAALAALLARSQKYLSLTGAARTEEARATLAANCVNVGLAATFQGRGILRVP
jgi:subtilisin family serine protease